MKPVIAMPTLDNSLFRIYMKSKYVFCLWKAGARVKWICLQDQEKMRRQLRRCDGMLLPGGGDIQPHLYGQIPTEKCGEPDKLRDSGEWAMLDAFVPTGKPILCVCRGEQLMNVYFGGTLHQDIGHLQKCNHDDYDTRATECHDVTLTPGSMAQAILGTDRCRVNSMHHQAVDKVGAGLRVDAVSEDGIVEALEKMDHPFFLGLQWHPEHMSRKRPLQQKIFEAFVRACK